MNKILRKKEIKKLVSAGFENQAVFIAKDGKEFLKEQEALDWEKKIITKKIL